jgi:hypothetical protein
MITYVHVYLLARLWYVAQVLPASRNCTQQITSSMTFFIRKGATFRVPICKLQSHKAGGGWELLDIYAKCKALLLSRMLSQGTREGSVHAVLLRKWNLDTNPANPPNVAAYTSGMVHLRAYATDMAYVPEPTSDDTIKKFRTRLYRALHIMASAATPARPCRVEMPHPNVNWHRIWSNLHASWVPDTVRSQWYMAIHDIMHTKECLHRIALADTAHCTNCGQIDILPHRLIDGGAGKEMWRWTQGNLATMLCTYPCFISDDWPLRPCFSLWPLRGTGLHCGSWPILSVIECNTPLRRPYRNSQTSWDGLAGRRTPCHSAANGSMIISPSWRRPPFALPMSSSILPCTGGGEEIHPLPPTNHNENQTIRWLVFASVVGVVCMPGGTPPLSQQ